MPPRTRLPLPPLYLRLAVLVLLALALAQGFPSQPAPDAPAAQEEDDYSDEELTEQQLEALERRRDAGLLAAIETAQVAPVAKIGTHSELARGALLRYLGHKGAFAHSLVVLSQTSGEFYKGFIVNVPLPAEERARAMQRLHLSGDEAVRLRGSEVAVWLGYGGPVRPAESEWVPIHRQLDIEGAEALDGRFLALGGDVEQLLARETDPAYALGFMLLYGSAVWLPGQLEREMDEGLWALERRDFPWPNALGSLPTWMVETPADLSANKAMNHVSAVVM
jgi:putative AlgH/UPF0301 family transcriptional regulator